MGLSSILWVFRLPTGTPAVPGELAGATVKEGVHPALVFVKAGGPSSREAVTFERGPCSQASATIRMIALPEITTLLRGLQVAGVSIPRPCAPCSSVNLPTPALCWQYDKAAAFALDCPLCPPSLGCPQLPWVPSTCHGCSLFQRQAVGFIRAAALHTARPCQLPWFLCHDIASFPLTTKR